MRSGVPTCPRHEEPLTNVGAKPPSMTLVVAVDGMIATQSEAEARRRLEAGAQQRQQTSGRPMSGVKPPNAGSW